MHDTIKDSNLNLNEEPQTLKFVFITIKHSSHYRDKMQQYTHTTQKVYEKSLLIYSKNTYED